MRTHIAIIGSGFGGLGVAIRLLQQGRKDFVLLERAHDVGGVWRDNTYPGAACDVQSHLYSFSFAPNPTWTRKYSPQQEIYRYLRSCAERFGVVPHIRFGHDVKSARWHDDHWRIETSQGVTVANILVAAGGALSEPSMPALPGLASFQGKVMHSARWDHAYAFEGKRVAVVGSGASAIQLVPKLQARVARLVVLQRTPPWIVPRHDRAISPRRRALFLRFPWLQRAARAAIAATDNMKLFSFRHRWITPLLRWLAVRHLKRSVHDPVLRAKLLPSYAVGCKRILISDDYLRSLSEPNVTLVNAGASAVRAHSIVDASGVEHAVDVIIFGTGFHVTDAPIAKVVFGREGRSLAEVWNGSPVAHVGTTIAGFPSFFLLQGPNSGLAHTSVILMIESQVEHILGAIEHLSAAKGRHVAGLEPKPAAQADFVTDIDKHMAGTVWTSGGCSSWYLDSSGRNSALWPLSTRAFHKRVAHFDPREYVEISEVQGG